MWKKRVPISVILFREAWSHPQVSAVGCVTSLFRGTESFLLLSWQ